MSPTPVYAILSSNCSRCCQAARRCLAGSSKLLVSDYNQSVDSDLQFVNSAAQLDSMRALDASQQQNMIRASTLGQLASWQTPTVVECRRGSNPVTESELARRGQGRGL